MQPPTLSVITAGSNICSARRAAVVELRQLVEEQHPGTGWNTIPPAKAQGFLQWVVRYDGRGDQSLFSKEL
jgi:hypothetical protein